LIYVPQKDFLKNWVDVTKSTAAHFYEKPPTIDKPSDPRFSVRSIIQLPICCNEGHTAAGKDGRGWGNLLVSKRLSKLVEDQWVLQTLLKCTTKPKCHWMSDFLIVCLLTRKEQELKSPEVEENHWLPLLKKRVHTGGPTLLNSWVRVLSLLINNSGEILAFSNRDYPSLTSAEMTLRGIELSAAAALSLKNTLCNRSISKSRPMTQRRYKHKPVIMHLDGSGNIMKFAMNWVLISCGVFHRGVAWASYASER
jgi:hypothetical protein